jgi:hypothetical protein
VLLDQEPVDGLGQNRLEMGVRLGRTSARPRQLLLGDRFQPGHEVKP